MNVFAKLLILGAVVVCNGCVGILGIQQHSVAGADGFVDCGRVLGEPRAGGVSLLSGEGNAIRIKSQTQDVMICGNTIGSDSQYLVGPILPVIPLFGLGAKRQPQESEFLMFNYSNKAATTIMFSHQMRACIGNWPIQTGVFDCEELSPDLRIIIPPLSAARVKTPFQSEHLFDVEGQKVKFIYGENLFFMITG